MASKKEANLAIDPNVLIQQFLEQNKDNYNDETYIEVPPAGTGRGNNGINRLLPFHLYLQEAGAKIVHAKIKDDVIKLSRDWTATEDGERVRTKEDVRITRTLPDGEVMDIAINGVKGIILGVYTTAGLGYYDPSLKPPYKNACGLVGYSTSGEGEDAQYIKGHVKKVFSSMTAYEPYVEGKKPEKSLPHHTVESAGLLGSRGESCADCIKAKHNRMLNSENKEIYCVPTSFVYMFVTEVYTTKRVGVGVDSKYQTNKQYALYDLGDELSVGEDGKKIPIVDIVSGDNDTPLKLQVSEDGVPVEGTGFILKLEFSPMRIKGKAWGFPPALGLEGYLTNLQRVQKQLSMPSVWETSIEARKVFSLRDNEPKEEAHGLYHIEGGIKVNPNYPEDKTYVANDFYKSLTLLNTPIVQAGQEMWKGLVSTDTLETKFISTVELAELYSNNFEGSSNVATTVSDDAVTQVDIDNTEVIISTQEEIAEDYF